MRRRSRRLHSYSGNCNPVVYTFFTKTGEGENNYEDVETGKGSVAGRGKYGNKIKSIHFTCPCPPLVFSSCSSIRLLLL
jgi:hypothetical protein